MSGAALDQPLLALLIEPSDGAAAKTQLLCDFPLRETLLVPEGIEAAKPIGKKSGTSSQQVQQLGIDPGRRKTHFSPLEIPFGKLSPAPDQIDGLVLNGVEDPRHVDLKVRPGLPERNPDFLQQIGDFLGV